MTLGAGIVGCGLIAGGYDRTVPDVTDPGAWSATHAGAYLLCPDTQLVGASDPSEKARLAFAEKWSCANVYAGHDELFANHAPNVVSICSPTATHRDLVEAAIKAGVKGIALEKPVAVDLADAVRMLDMSGGVPVVVNFTRRFNPSYAKMADRLRNGAYGRVLSAVFRYTKGLIVNGSHHIDTARWFFGEITDATHLKTHAGNDDDKGVDFRLSFDGETDAYFLHVPDADFVFFDIEIVTERGRLRIAQRGQQIAFDDAIPEPHYGVFNIIGPKHTVESEWRNCATRAIQNLADCVNNGSNPQCTLEDGIEVMRIIDTLKKAA